ncbi:16S rRNA (cytosine(1402)-N(4))-methyltransferase RsmH [Patescibacteria group bacterium]
MKNNYHKPVMLNEALHYLQPLPDLRYIDCTLGDGGHTLELLRQGSEVLGIDAFPNALERAKKRIKEEGLRDKFSGVVGNFKDLQEIAEREGFSDVNGILFDLGYSSYELDEGGIGLTFQKDEPLDMRMDKDLGVTAADLLNTLPEKQLAKIIRDYGGENMANRFAKEIVKFRNLKKFQTTKELKEVIESAAPSGYERGRINPATRTFQALRIAVNDEIENLKKALPQAARLLLPGGRMIVISFHSLEDKATKKFGRLDVQPSAFALDEVTKKPLVPTAREVDENIRSRSAKMRVYEKSNKTKKNDKNT